MGNFAPGVKFSISTWNENIFAEICGMFYTNVLRKKHLKDYVKAIILDFINMIGKMFNLEHHP